MNTLPGTKELTRAFLAGDASYDGIFFVAVRTTGIFCRPSCPARKPLLENVEFHANTREALFAGFRPCKRCRPLDTNGRHPPWVASLLKEIDQKPTARLRAADLRKRSIDPARARRYFQKHLGMTFQAYCRGRRMSEALQQIRGGASLDNVALENGYDSHSGFREAFGRLFGTPPGRSRSKDCVVTGWVESPIGPLLTGATSAGICLLEFTDRRALEMQCRTLGRRFGCPIVPGNNEFLERLKEELSAYFAGQLREFRVPLVYPGTPFQKAVWEGLLQIPYGRTCSYEDLAVAVGIPRAPRAVGRANGMNRIAIVIPCHRVVNKGGRLGGYGGGLWRKKFLLDLERDVVEGRGPA
jgi:AraC family transcriptional regulator of adaptative response/methylated-DNA-[protein]-cysteine methyltransferase